MKKKSKEISNESFGSGFEEGVVKKVDCALNFDSDVSISAKIEKHDDEKTICNKKSIRKKRQKSNSGNNSPKNDKKVIKITRLDNNSNSTNQNTNTTQNKKPNQEISNSFEDLNHMFTEDVNKFIGEFVSDTSEIKVVRGFIYTSDHERLFYTKIESTKLKPQAN